MSTAGGDFNTASGWPDAGAASRAEDAERTTLISAIAAEPESNANQDDGSTRWHGGLDFGLLVLRIVLGGIMCGHGLQKLFGTFGGPGIGGFATALQDVYGFTSYVTALSWVTALTETIAGALLVLGALTPLAAAGILGVTASVVAVKFGAGLFGPQGFEYELLLAASAFTLLLTGAGRLSVDASTPWRRKPMPYAVLGVLLAAAACVVVLVAFR